MTFLYMETWPDFFKLYFMYSFHRHMKVLKGYVRNCARPEGCIAECYLADECMQFCSTYIPQAENIGDKHNRNEDLVKRRGPNQINFNKITRAKEVGVTFNELGQLVGDSSVALSTCIGTITTQMIPITYSSWPEVLNVVKNSVWETTKARFGLDDVGKSNVFNSMNTYWRQYKSRLTKGIRELYFGLEVGRMIQLLKPTNITDEDWSQFVSNRLSSELDIISSKYSNFAKKNKAPYITSRKGLARLREDLVDRVETWIAGHKHKDGTPVIEDAKEIIKQMEGISTNQLTSISDDVVSQVLGKEHRGRVRGLGGGITPTRVNTSVVGKQTTTQLREEMKKQNKRHEDEMNSFKQQLQDLQSFVFNIQVTDNIQVPQIYWENNQHRINLSDLLHNLYSLFSTTILMNNFWNILDDYLLVDLGYSGPDYTWSNCRSGSKYKSVIPCTASNRVIATNKKCLMNVSKGF
ncbi:hypothetical protein ACOSQ3_004398 [Xanthoceras sorbifolium]